MRRLSLWSRVFLGLAVFSLLGSLLTRLTGLEPGLVRPIASAAMLLSGVLALWSILAKTNCVKDSVAAVVLVVLLGFTAEVVGLYTSLPFGRYAYTDQWAPTVLLPGDQRFPLLLPLAWFLVAGGSMLAMPKLGWIEVPLAAILATLIDLVMEPVMTGPLGYWKWVDRGPLPGGVPWMNSLGWLCTSLLAALFVRGFCRSKPNPIEARWILGSYLLLVLGLGLIGTS